MACDLTRHDHVQASPRSKRSRLLAGIGRDLNIYDMGLKSLLRKATRVDCAPTTVAFLNTQGNRTMLFADGGCSSKLETIGHSYTNNVPLSVHKSFYRWLSGAGALKAIETL